MGIENIEDLKPEEVVHPEWPKNDGDHVFDRWRPWSRTEVYRECVHPNCSYIERKPAPKG